MTLSLSLPERIGVYILLSECKVGPRAFLNLIKDAKKAIEIKKEEMSEYGITGRPDGGIDWNKESADKTKDFTLSEGAYNFLKSRLEDLEKQEKLHIDLLPIANKILEAA